MAASARKKSVGSAFNIDLPPSLPTQTNTLLNKSAASSSSLYQQCSQLRARLSRIKDFPLFLEQSVASQNPDPVNHLWDCFALGIPLCYLFNMLPPPATPIDIQTHPSEVDLDPTNVKAAKIAIINFIMAIKKLQQQSSRWETVELFQVTELTDRNMGGFVKVITTVTELVNSLPQSAFVVAEEEVPSPIASASYPSINGSLSGAEANSPVLGASTNSREGDRRNIILELINTERKYVGDLEVMQKYATALLQRSVIDQDTILELFPGLNKLLDFQRRFLIRLEQVYEVPWSEQRWGKPFSDCESEFEVYAPYCANYDNAVDVLLREEQHLMELASLIHPKSDLPAFLIKPIQRICKYPLLLDSLIKACTPQEYPYYQELVEGSASTKRVTARINEAQRRAENRQIMKALESRIEDWKGHHIVNFGELLLQDFFSVTKSDVDRDYHVFLFEKIILCCKEYPQSAQSKKVSKSNSILKKQAAGMPPNPFPGGPSASARKGTTPLLLKGRIFLNNVIDATPVGKTASHDLRVSWRGDDDTEHFTLRCRNEEQLKLWETQITKLISSSVSRRRAAQSSIGPNSTNPAALRLQSHSYSRASPDYQSGYSGGSSNYAGSRASTPFSADDRWSRARPPGPEQGFDPDDDFEDASPLMMYPQSGRGTPMGSRRSGAAQSMPPERDIPPGYDRPRARTEDHSGQIMQQWRNNGHQMPPPPPPPIGGLPHPPSSARPSASRMTSDGSFASSDVSRYPPSAARGSLRSQFSSARLRSTYESDETLVTPQIARTSSAVSGQSMTQLSAQSRSRSASLSSHSHGSTYQMHSTPPVPQYSSGRSPHPPSAMEREMKRESNSSNSTEGSSDFSVPHSTSPITPYGSTESSLASSTLRSARSQIFQKNGSGATEISSPPLKVKVHYGDDLFVIMVNRSTDFNDLVEKVGKKIRLCGGRREGVPLRVKYQDEDGDMVSLGSNDDVQMAFDTSRGGQVTLFVL